MKQNTEELKLKMNMIEMSLEILICLFTQWSVKIRDKAG
jgi:hypothetical protein